MNNSSTHHESVSQRSQTISVSSKRKYKIILLGDSGAGKTSIISRFINSTFQPNENPTIGIDFLVKNMNYKGNTVRVQLWDTAGQQKFKSLIPNYLKDATAAIFVFDLARPQTLKNLEEWIAMYRDHNNQQGGLKSLVGMFCGNKSDIEQQKLDKQKLYELMDRYKFPYQSVSAKTGSNIEELFYLTLQMIVSKQMEEKNMMKKKSQDRKVANRVEEDKNEEDEPKTQRAPDTEVRLNGKSRGNDCKESGEKQTENIKLNKDEEQLQRNNCKC